MKDGTRQRRAWAAIAGLGLIAVISVVVMLPPSASSLSEEELNELIRQIVHNDSSLSTDACFKDQVDYRGLPQALRDRLSPSFTRSIGIALRVPQHVVEYVMAKDDLSFNCVVNLRDGYVTKVIVRRTPNTSGVVNEFSEQLRARLGKRSVPVVIRNSKK